MITPHSSKGSFDRIFRGVSALGDAPMDRSQGTIADSNWLVDQLLVGVSNERESFVAIVKAI